MVALVGCVVFTTMQIQDMKGQAGDRTRSRRSVPLTLEDWAARWTVAVPVLTWFIICLLFLSLGFLRYLATGGFGIVIAWRIWLLSNVQADQKTWKLWTAWTALLYLLPLLKNHSFIIDEFICLTGVRFWDIYSPAEWDGSDYKGQQQTSIDVGNLVGKSFWTRLGLSFLMLT